MLETTLTRIDIAYDILLTTTVTAHNDLKLGEPTLSKEEIASLNKIIDLLEEMVKRERVS